MTILRLLHLFVFHRITPGLLAIAALGATGWFPMEVLSQEPAQTANFSPPKPRPQAESLFEGQPQLLAEQGAGEGPAWDSQLGLLTSHDRQIYRRHLDGQQSIYLENAGSNGLMFDGQGGLIVCQPVQRRVIRLAADKSVSVLAETYQGMKFNQPNDLAMDSKKRIYFSDPCYGDRSHMEMRDEKGQSVEGVYRIDPTGQVTRVIGREVERANGLVVTADDKYLFVADNNNSQGGARKLFRFALRSDGSVELESRQLIFDWGQTRGPDGMKLDVAGNLYVAAGLNKPNPPHETASPPTAGIYVFTPVGKLVEFVPIPRDETTNCGFGGADRKTLFVTAGGTLWSIRTRNAGR